MKQNLTIALYGIEQKPKEAYMINCVAGSRKDKSSTSKCELNAQMIHAFFHRLYTKVQNHDNQKKKQQFNQLPIRATQQLAVNDASPDNITQEIIALNEENESSGNELHTIKINRNRENAGSNRTFLGGEITPKESVRIQMLKIFVLNPILFFVYMY